MGYWSKVCHISLLFLLVLSIGSPANARLNKDQEKQLKKELKINNLEYHVTPNGFEYYIASNKKYKGVLNATTGDFTIPLEMESIEFINIPETNGWFLAKQKTKNEPLYSFLFDIDGDTLISKANTIEINPDYSCVYTINKGGITFAGLDQMERISRDLAECIFIKKGGILLTDPTIKVPACFNTVKYVGNGSWVVSSLESGFLDIPFEKDFRYPSEDSNLFFISLYEENSLTLMEEAIQQNGTESPLNNFYLGLAYLKEGYLRSLEYQVFTSFCMSLEGYSLDMKIPVINQYLKSMVIDNDEIVNLITQGLSLINEYSDQDYRYDTQIESLRKKDFNLTSTFADFERCMSTFREEEAQYQKALQAPETSQNNFFINLLSNLFGAMVSTSVDNLTSSMRGASRTYNKPSSTKTSGKSASRVNESSISSDSSQGGPSERVLGQIRNIEKQIRHEEEQLQKSQERYQKNHDSGERSVMEAHKRALAGYKQILENLINGKY